MILLSVIIPVKNGGATLSKCLEAIRFQTIAEQIEIIVLDSMSTDNSRKIAEDFKAITIDVPNGTFNHGATRNLGVEYAQGELIYFTVQDAYLAQDDQLEKMCAYFNDTDTQSVAGIQAIPKEADKNPAIWFKRFSRSIPEIRQFSENSFAVLPAKKQLENCNWDNVNAMYRKSALQLLPFKKTDFAEDTLWARGALLRGWKIVRDSSFIAYHYHHQTFSYSFTSSFMLNYTFWQEFKILPRFPSLMIPFARNVYSLIKKRELSNVAKLKWTGHNFLRLAGKYLSILLFRLAYMFGNENLLKKSYYRLCSKIPQGLPNTA